MGDSYEGQLRLRVHGPLGGLGRTSLPAGPDLKRPSFIHGYDNDPSERPPQDLGEILAAGWAWASGGVVATPRNLDNFARGYVKGELFDARTRRGSAGSSRGGRSEPPGPGNKLRRGLGVSRNETVCGTVWGRTGDTPGYTRFMAASPDGGRSVTVSVDSRPTPKDGVPGVFDALRCAEGRAVRAALAER